MMQSIVIASLSSLAAESPSSTLSHVRFPVIGVISSSSASASASASCPIVTVTVVSATSDADVA
jgi:hypothetical protein